ncbi:alpha/beta hydrolase [Streptomyces sp. NBC_00083]|uniref:alpha/beta hydrolase n=1 Tax=Streptomyces sp. NBC_00083 TaxID=2975647 RepID=UPI002256E346|nr:alpha/beta hydrolase [Streptomyces sp. NBC_00083]MCX5382676.1 alpha/beta hydrolase family protein [Streptomyces sp. NBC_00083]
MTSFDSSPTLNAWRALLALAVVFVMLATSGWTAIRGHSGDSEPRAKALAAWARDTIDGHKLPKADGTAQQLAQFFGSITAAERDRLADRYPLVVGNLNGAPVTLRYRANRVALAEARTVEEKRTVDPRLSADGRQDASRRMHRFDSLLDDDRQILAFDPSDTGRVAEVFGDLDHARRISVIIPGVDTNVLTFEKTSRKNTAPAGMAESLYTAEHAAAPGTRTAVIAWADYTAPAGLGMDAAIGRLAEEGAVRLSAMVRALPGTAPVELFCHSYGSVVCGVSTRELPPRVSDIAVAGSPGMRVRNAAQLGTKAQVWAMRDRDDWIQDVPYLDVAGLGHGADPVSPAFGSRVLSAAGAVGHTGYFEPGTQSLANFAAIGVGAYRTVGCSSTDADCADGISDRSAA